MDRTKRTETTSLWRGFWRLADPRISLASVASVFLGVCAALATATWSPAWLFCAVLPAVYAIEIAKNASGEVFDFHSGVDLAVRPQDRSPFSGGKRVLVERILSRQQTVAIAVAGYSVGIALGLILIVFRTPEILWLGLAGIACAFFYQAPPLKLSYRGFGELAVALCYGPLICLGTYLVMTRQFSTDPVLVAVPLGLLIACFLLINEFPDFHADRSGGKKTLVVRLGKPIASWIYVLTMLLAFLISAVLPLCGLPRWVWAGGIAAVPAGLAARIVLRHREDTAGLIRGQALTLGTFVLYSVGTGLGLVLASAG